MSTASSVVVATEDDPARAEWIRAAQETGAAIPRFVSWSAVAGSEAEFEPGDIVFAERLYPHVAEDPVRGQRARYIELQAALSQLGGALTKVGATSATPAEPTLLALDRTTRDDLLRDSGVKVLDASDVSAMPSPIMRPRYAGSDDWMIDSWRTRLYRHRTRAGFEVWRAPGAADVDRSEVADMVALLADDGIHAVQSVRHGYLGAFYGFRFAVVNGKVTHAAGVLLEQEVLREWYGGKRREIDNFLQRSGIERWNRMVALAEHTATFFPGIRSLGVDVIADNDTGEYVFDVNPFGASLPGLLGTPPNVEREPISVRAAVLRSLSAGS